jgi:hypothetical protein
MFLEGIRVMIFLSKFGNAFHFCLEEISKLLKQGVPVE